MSEPRICPVCHKAIPAAAPAGLCPACLMKEGMQQPSANPQPATTPYAPAGSRFTPLEPAALQKLFPTLQVLELLGHGGMGAVYKARQPGLDRFIAIKVLPPEISQDPAFVERFTREARALAKLNHPNIIAVYDFGQAHPSPPGPLPQGERGEIPAGFCWFMMEYVDGVNLRQAIRAGDLKPAEALKIVPQICDALQFAHDEGIVHRDIKPENILIDKRGRVKIADFGLAKMLGAAALDLSLTGTQQAMGTLHYMAPEQFQGARDVDHRADIYSLGVTFYEMLTGELPIGRFAAPSKKVEIDVRLDEVVLRSLEQKPEQRYQHASEIKTEVESITRGPAPVTVTPAPKPPIDEHPLLKGTRFAMTPQPGYGSWVGIPTLILTALYVAASIGCVALGAAFDGPQWISMLPMCVGAPILLVIFGVLNIVWMIRRNSAVRAEAAKDTTPKDQAPSRVSFVYPVLLPCAILVVGYLIVVTAAGVGLPLVMQDGGPGHLMATIQTIILFGGAALVLLVCPSLFAIWLIRKLLEWHTEAADEAPRPWAVPVIAIFNLFVALFFLFIAVSDLFFPGDVPASIVDNETLHATYKVWLYFEAISGYVTGALWFAAAIGLLLWKNWGRVVTVWTAVLLLAMFVLEIPAYVGFAFIPIAEEIQLEAGPDATQQALYGTFVFLMLAMSILIGLAYLIFELVYFTRPRVVAAFRETEPA